MHSDKWGPVGSIVAALCCLGVAPVLGALSALGLGFLINDLILIPLHMRLGAGPTRLARGLLLAMQGPNPHPRNATVAARK